MENNKTYYKLELEELESLSKVGGSDNAVGVETRSAVVASAAWGVSELVTAVTALTVSWSTLYSCTQNSKICNR